VEFLWHYCNAMCSLYTSVYILSRCFVYILYWCRNFLYMLRLFISIEPKLLCEISIFPARIRGIIMALFQCNGHCILLFIFYIGAVTSCTCTHRLFISILHLVTFVIELLVILKAFCICPHTT
jgi:hypothetical protein